MTLSDHQADFLRDMALMIIWANNQGMKVVAKELLRTMLQQEAYLKQGKTKTLNSQHLKALAIDLVVFLNDGTTPSWDRKDYLELGRFWEDLDPHNYWGGNFDGFVDAVHFERRETPREKRK